MNHNTTIDTPLLRELVRRGSAGQLIVRGVPGGFILIVRHDLDEQLLGAQRGHARKFKRLDAVASYLETLGVRVFEVDLNGWARHALV